MSWTDEQKQEVIEAYEAEKPNPQNTSDIIAELAEQFDKTKNGVRLILSTAGVYIKKDPASTTSTDSDKPARISKADAQESLKVAIESVGKEANMDIIEKLTGKAANYFAGLFTADTKEEEEEEEED